MSTKGLVTEIELVTPAKAHKWLKNNPNNRTLRAGKIQHFANMMKAGQWRLTHQGIAFNCDGSLKDGQHRLEAVVKSGVSVKMMVTHNLPNDAMLFIDTHTVRTDADAFKIEGFESITTGHVATAKRMYFGSSADFGVIDRETLLAFIREYQEHIWFACRLLSAKGCTHASIRGAVARALVTRPTDRIEQFCDVLKTGVMANNEEDYAAHQFREWMNRNGVKMGGGSIARAEVYKRCESSLRAFLDKRKLEKLYASEKELFPIPWDKKNG